MPSLLSSLVSLASHSRIPALLMTLDDSGHVAQVEATDNETTIIVTRPGSSAPVVDYGAPIEEPRQVLVSVAPIKGGKVDILSATLRTVGAYSPEVPAEYEPLPKGASVTAYRTVKTPAVPAKCPKLALPGGATVPTLDPVCFPPFPVSEDPSVSTCPAFPFAVVAREVGYAITEDGTRYGLNGLHLEKVTAEGTLVTDGIPSLVRACATDGSRLATYDTGALVTGDLPRKMLIPGKALDYLSRVFSTVDPSVTWYPRSFVALAKVEGWEVRVHVRLIDGEFPAYRSVIPRENYGTIKCDRATLLSAVRSMLPYAQDRASTITVAISLDGKSMYLHARSVDAGERHVSIPCEATRLVKTMRAEKGADPVPYLIPVQGYNATFLVDALSLGGPDVMLGVQHELSPVVVTDPSEPARYAIVMPIRVDIVTSEEQVEALCHGERLEPVTVKPSRKPSRKPTPTQVPESAPTHEVGELHTALNAARAETESVRSLLAGVRAERDALRAQVEGHAREIRALTVARDLAQDAVTALRLDLDAERATVASLRKATPGPVVEVAPVVEILSSPVVVVAPPRLVESSEVSALPVSPCTRAEDAPAAYARARAALREGNADSMRAALAGLPVWPSKKCDTLKAELSAALRQVA